MPPNNRTGKQFVLWFLLSLGIGIASATGSWFWISKFQGDALGAKKADQENQIQTIDKEEKALEIKKQDINKQLEDTNTQLAKIKFEEIKSKLTPKRNEKADRENETTPPDKIQETIRKSGDKDKITIAREDLKKFIDQRNTVKNLEGKGISKNFTEALKTNQALQVPDSDSKDNALIQAIHTNIETRKGEELIKKKETQGPYFVRLYLKRLAEGKESLSEILKGGTSPDPDITKRTFSDFNSLAKMFPPKDKIAEVNLFFAMEYFPKQKDNLLQTANAHFKDKKGEKEAWMNNHWKPMEKLVSKAGIQ